MSTCKYCEEYFTPRRKAINRNQLYCSKLCKGRAINSRRRTTSLNWRFMVLKRDGFRCHYCGRNPVEDGVKLEVDHYIPRSKGGKDKMYNYVAACWECNHGKRDMLL